MKKHFAQIMESPLFVGISETDLQTMLNCMGVIVKNYRKGEIIFLMNDEVRYIGMVMSGCVHMVKENSQGDKTLLSIFRKGDVFGESFACGEDRFAYTSFIATENVTVLFVPFQKVMRACNMRCAFHHRMIENMVTIIANKNVRLMQKIDVSSQKTVREKILSYLKIKQLEQGKEYVDLQISKTILAEYLGVNRSALARELSQMKADGILDYEKKRFWILEQK